MLKVRNLDFSYVKDNPVLRKIAFETQSGECTAILGNNGAGKTTLLKCLNRILTPQKGSVYINFSSFQTNLLSLPQKKIARAVSYLAQEAPSGDMTVYDTVMLGRLPYLKWGVTSKDIEIVNSAIEQLGLTTFSQRPAHTLSGGERQKVALARALAQRAKILLLDEPTSSLDLKNQHEVLGLVQDICKKNEMSAIMVIHDLNLALRFCDRYILMKDNRVLATGGEEVITSENISKVYQMPVSIHEIDNMKLVIPKSE